MKSLAWLSGCLIAMLSACSGTVAAPALSHRPPAPAAVTSAATGARPAPAPPATATGARPASAPPATAQTVVAVVTGYYRAIVTRNYQKAFGYLAPGATGPDGHRLTVNSFLQLARMLDGMGGPVTRFSIGVAPAGVVLTLYRVKYGPYHAHLQLTRTSHGWGIGSIDRI